MSTSSTADCATALCGSCIGGEHHVAHPLHRLQTWTGIRMTHKQLGLRLLLGHDGASQCPQRVLQQDFTVVNRGGMLQIDVAYCGCVGVPSRLQQLMDAVPTAIRRALPEPAAPAPIANTSIKRNVASAVDEIPPGEVAGTGDCSAEDATRLPVSQKAEVLRKFRAWEAAWEIDRLKEEEAWARAVAFQKRPKLPSSMGEATATASGS
ncbi:hypothetical protein DFH07DRAFT_779738 [Mycena maculata]|uniref:CxC2-like cysteine cluster KDZ transposase-associated domain-containing protein n=1 Tax=Mycena maculata TaxID=230809 RepID=A0AAD7MYB6_9AGAR|nr:hypothetical protein DFH07DRAFT_779738 [Mycena maculata]